MQWLGKHQEMIVDAEQYRELAARYREYGDIELQELAAEAADLTETAQQALTAEMQLRKLLAAGQRSSEARAAYARWARHAIAA